MSLRLLRNAFLNKNLKIIYKCDKEARQKYGIITNCEFVPAENLGIKNYHWDLKDGYVVNPKRNCYNSYFYLPDDSSINILDKFILHGKDTTKYLDGGQPIMVAVYAWATDINLVNHANGCSVSETHC